MKGPYWQDFASPGSVMLVSRAAHAWLTLESRAGSLLQSGGWVKHVDSAFPVSGPLVGGSPLQRVGRFSVLFFTNFFFLKQYKLSECPKE